MTDNIPFKRVKVEILAIDEKAIKELDEFLHGFNIAGGSVDYKGESSGYLDDDGNEVEVDGS